jgi:endonuclease/exonuclease/phosphatase family metal-dependent hydrolase
MTSPLRFSVCTYNVWGRTRWPERREALAHAVRSLRPDILCTQEVQPGIIETLDLELGPTHDRVHDEFEGWLDESNIWWHRERFDLLEAGAEDVGILEPLRRLFWVLLRQRDGDCRSVLVATAHWTWHGHPEARRTEANVRMPQARATVAALDRLTERCPDQLFMGDLNDTTEPLAVLREAGFVDCFAELGLWSDATHPARPTPGVPQTIDWIVRRGELRSVLAHVADIHLGDLAPSDHRPVIAVYEH